MPCPSVSYYDYDNDVDHMSYAGVVGEARIVRPQRATRPYASRVWGGLQQTLEQVPGRETYWQKQGRTIRCMHSLVQLTIVSLIAMTKQGNQVSV